MKDKTMLVVSAHAADFVWRSGGVIAKYINEGAKVYVIVLSFGVRGESNDLWKIEGQNYENVKSIRLNESKNAADILGVKNIEYWDYEDYPIEITRERIDRLALRIREIRPDIVITHDKNDLFNPDHNTVSEFVFKCCVLSNSRGVQLNNTKATKQMGIYGFEPHQTEISNYVPGIIIDITDTYEQKVRAMQCFKSQSHLIEYYTQRAFMRGNHARRISGINSYKYAESFSRFFPVVAREFV